MAAKRSRSADVDEKPSFTAELQALESAVSYFRSHGGTGIESSVLPALCGLLAPPP